MDENRQPGHSSFLGFGEILENMDPAFSTHPRYFSFECARMDVLAITPLYLTMGCGRFLRSRSQVVKNHGVVFHFQARSDHRLEMKIWGWFGWID